MADIFISYARDDSERVLQIVELISEAGWTVYWDRNIAAGKTWRKNLEKALDSAKCIIAVWSRISIKSQWVHEEADEGKNRGILIPVLIDNVTPPLGFRSFQHVDLTDWNGETEHPSAEELLADIEGVAPLEPFKEPISITTTRPELLDKISEQTRVSRSQVTMVLSAFEDALREELKKDNGRVILAGFGTFYRVRRKSRMGRNPQTGERIKIKGKNIVRFKPGKKLLDSI
jgi:nucleoid DNA-binding protein